MRTRDDARISAIRRERHWRETADRSREGIHAVRCAKGPPSYGRNTSGAGRGITTSHGSSAARDDEGDGRAGQRSAVLIQDNDRRRVSDCRARSGTLSCRGIRRNGARNEAGSGRVAARKLRDEQREREECGAKPCCVPHSPNIGTGEGVSRINRAGPYAEMLVTVMLRLVRSVDRHR
jgi:hypothetical protein